MKRSQKISKGLALVLAAASVLTVGCGGSKDNIQHSVAPPVTPGYPNPGYPGGMGACVPITQPIPFSAHNVYVDSKSTIAEPNQVIVGQVAQIGTGTTYSTVNFYGSQVSIRLSFNNQHMGTYPNQPQGYYPTNPIGGSTASISGNIILSHQQIQAIQFQSGGFYGGNYGPGYGYPQQPGYGYPNQPGYMPQQPGMHQVPCVRRITVDTGYNVFNGQPTLFQGSLYLELGNGSGMPVQVLL